MDLFFGAILNAVIALGFGWLGWQMVRRVTEKTAGVLLLVALTLLLLAAFGLRDRLFWAAWFPVSNVGVLCNPVSPAAAFLASVVGQRMGGTPRRKRILTWGLGILGFMATFAPELGPTPTISPKSDWQEGVLQQTSPGTCGAASAVTLLRSVGITSTEQEMATLCHTTKDGTPMLDIYRGLGQITQSRGYKPVAITTTDLPELRRIVAQGPVLLSVLFMPVETERVNRFQSAFRAHHAVLVFGFRPDGSAEIGDPMQGRTVWSEQEFLQRWPGEGIQLQRQ